MELFLVRHAWAGHFGDPEWPDDSLRPLDAAGRKRFGRMAAKLARGGLAPTLIAASPMARCLQTAEILAAKIGVAAEVVVHDELLSGGNLDDLLAWTAEQAARHAQIAWVGHEPDASNHAAALLGCRAEAMRFRKGAVCAIRFADFPRRAAGQLRWLATAKMLNC